MRRRAGSVVLGLMLLGACNGAGAGAADVARLCGEHLDVPAAICDCIADRAESQLDPQGRQLLVAMLEEDTERAADIRGDMEVAEITEVAMFFTSAPAACAAEASGGTP